MNNLVANWPAPHNIGAITTTRLNGKSHSSYDSNNMALHVGDRAADVEANRKTLVKTLGLPGEPVWLEQHHGTRCIIAEKTADRTADAAITQDKTYPLAILTADCLPILLCDRRGLEIAAIHAGWKGLANGIIENTLEKMQHKPSELLAWIGPGICASCYEVGDAVTEAFASAYPGIRACFNKHNEHWHVDLPLLAQMILAKQGLNTVYQSAVCTKEDKNSFYSYRRDGQTGRMATLIWFKKDNDDAK